MIEVVNIENFVANKLYVPYIYIKWNHKMRF